MCAPDQFVEIDAVARSDGDANSNIKLGRHLFDRDSLGGGRHNTARQIRGIVEGTNVLHDNPEFVLSNPCQDAILAQEISDPVGKFA